MSLYRALREIIWNISRRSEALQGPFVLLDELVCEGMESRIKWFPLGWINEGCNVFIWLKVKMVNDFESSVKVVQVPLKFLPVEACGAWDEGTSPLQKMALR